MPYSFSQLNTYRTCPRQYEFANVKKISRSISAGESFGSSVHNTLSKWGKLEIGLGSRGLGLGNQLALFQSVEEESPLPLSFDTLSRLWHQSFIFQGYASKVDGDKARAKGEVLMQHFFEWWIEKEREVLAVERGFRLKEGKDSKDSKDSQDLIIAGRFDRVEEDSGSSNVIDFKTGGLRTQEEVDADLQLSIYALAAEQEFDMPCTKLTLMFLHEDGITEVHTSRSDGRLAEAMQQIDTLGGGIEDAQFDPTPSLGACGRCPYKGVCDAAFKS